MVTRCLRHGAFCAILVAVVLGAPPASGGDRDAAGAMWYISPKGSDDNGGREEIAPFRSFRRAFAAMQGGDELVLLDGEYSEGSGTGIIAWPGMDALAGTLSAQAPSGRGRDRPTIVRAKSPGSVKVRGRLFVGRKVRKDRDITFEGITFVGGGHLYNSEGVVVRRCGFNGTFGIGTNDHHEGNERNLVEDVWIWASGERIIAINYRARQNVWRRVVVRGDGCGTTRCRGSGNPNVGITVYDSSDVSLQNVIVVDRILAPGDSPYADFAVAQHTEDVRYHLGRNEWLGTISLGAPDSGYYMEPDYTLDRTIRISNAIAWRSRGVGFNLARAGSNMVLEHLSVGHAGADGIRVAPELKSGVLRDSFVAYAGRYGINSAFAPRNVSVFKATAGPYLQNRCAGTCLEVDPFDKRTGPVLRHLPRIERGSVFKGKGTDGGDIGANIVMRYGKDGSRHGEPGFNELTAVPLWPWPNEARMRVEMCADIAVHRGFCLSPSFTRYIWELLGTSAPEEVQKGAPGFH